MTTGGTHLRQQPSLTKAIRINWLSMRPEYWPPPGRKPLLGIAYLAFGIGTAGTAWISRLKRSPWFAGLAPRQDDLAVAGGVPAGCWTMPAASVRSIHSEIAAFVASGYLPSAALATIAVTALAGQDDLAATCELVTALRQSRDAHGCRSVVTVTIEPGNARITDAYVIDLLDRGAFVVRPGLGAFGDHIHHFPLRAVTLPRKEYRLICIDFADYLACWAAGSSADLHVIPSSFEDAMRTLLQLPAAGIPRASALNLHFHIDAGVPGNFLADIDRLAEQCHALFLRPDGQMVFTHADRLDGIVGPADLLIVHERVRHVAMSASVADAAH